MSFPLFGLYIKNYQLHFTTYFGMNIFVGFNAMNAIEETLVFYNYPFAFNPAKGKLALEEKGLKVQTKTLK